MKQEKQEFITGPLNFQWLKKFHSIKNKKAVSTVEMLVSFTIFVGFVVFILAYINPVARDVTPTLVVALEAGLKDVAMTELREWPFSVNKSNAPACMHVLLPFVSTQPGNIAVLAINGTPAKYKANPPIDVIIDKLPEEKLYRLIKSDEIDTIVSATCVTGTNPEQISWSVERVEKIFSFKKLMQINQSYYDEAGYTTLKQQLNYPLNADFAVYITNGMNFTMNKSIPVNVKILAKQYPIEILKNTERIKAEMIIYVW